jgi:hypothetical protein
MGNQQSSPPPPPPSNPPPSPAPPPPPPPPVCDAACQRQKLLDGLKTTLDQKEETQDTDPEGYEQARIAYYTALNGQGWLTEEQNRIASDEIEPVLSKYTNQYNSLNNQIKTNKVFSNLAASLQTEQKEDEEDVRFLKKQFQKEKDQADVLDRLTSLTNSAQQTSSSNLLPILADFGIVVLGLFVIYMIYLKFPIIKGWFVSQPTAVPMGGKRLPK